MPDPPEAISPDRPVGRAGQLTAVGWITPAGPDDTSPVAGYRRRLNPHIGGLAVVRIPAFNLVVQVSRIGQVTGGKKAQIPSIGRHKVGKRKSTSVDIIAQHDQDGEVGQCFRPVGISPECNRHAVGILLHRNKRHSRVGQTGAKGIRGPVTVIIGRPSLQSYQRVGADDRRTTCRTNSDLSASEPAAQGLARVIGAIDQAPGGHRSRTGRNQRARHHYRMRRNRDHPAVRHVWLQNVGIEGGIRGLIHVTGPDPVRRTGGTRNLYIVNGTRGVACCAIPADPAENCNRLWRRRR